MVLERSFQQAESAGSGGASGASGSSTGGVSGGGSAGSIGNVGGGGSHTASDIASLVLDPPSATIEVNDGASTPVQFSVRPVYTDGTTGSPINDAVWQVNPGGDIASTTAAGVVSATGTRGGVATLNVTSSGVSATADVTVNVHINKIDPAITTDDQTALTGASQTDGATAWLYPYDNTVFPRGLLAPELMWNGSVAGDKMQVTLTGEHTSVNIFFIADGTGQYAMDQNLWVALTESGTGGPVTVRVARIDSANNPSVVANEHWSIASGSLRGTVYFWAISPGRVLRIKPGATAPEDFMASDPYGGTGCTTCHTVSANGKTLVMGNGDDPSDSDSNVFDLINNVTTASDRGRKWAMPALSPDGKYAVLSGRPTFTGDPNYSGFFDVATGQEIPGTGLDDLTLDMPAFAPNGSRIAYIDHTTRALSAVEVNLSGPTPQATNPHELIPFDGDGTHDMNFPSVSPDGKWAVYHRGYQDTRSGLGRLYMASLETPGLELPLSFANGEVSPSPFVDPNRDVGHTYEPNFAPIPAGGYYWVIFTSQRTYGNRLTAPAIVYDAANNPNSGVKQLWVVAIKQNPQQGEDPSHAPFWLPGQALNNLNMRAFWALDPCREDGNTCETASQCCSGSCLSDGTCGVPPGQTCTPVGAACTTSADCCGAADGYTCVNGVCTEPAITEPG
ncbi:MAG: dickkopf-related protein [Polyangiaceae bacterium]